MEEKSLIIFQLTDETLQYIISVTSIIPIFLFSCNMPRDIPQLLRFPIHPRRVPPIQSLPPPGPFLGQLRLKAPLDRVHHQIADDGEELPRMGRAAG